MPSLRPPLVSVIIPACNGERYIGDTMASIGAQTRRDFEVIVVDDGSTDDTAAVLRSYRTSLEYVLQPRSGQSVARNRGAALAQGKYLAFLDHDDCWEPAYLERTVAYLEGRSDVGLVAVAARTITATGRRSRRIAGKGSAGEEYSVASLVGGDAETIINPVIRTEVFRRSGGYDPSFSQAGDSDLWLRLPFLTRMCYLAEPLLLYRLHPGNTSKNVVDNAREWLRVLDKFEAEHPQHARELAGLLAKKRALHLLRLGRDLLARSPRARNDLRDAQRSLLRSLRFDPRQPRAHLYLALSLLPGLRSLYPTWRRRELRLRETLIALRSDAGTEAERTLSPDHAGVSLRP